jgi:uncharacterized membrane protein YfcA
MHPGGATLPAYPKDKFSMQWLVTYVAVGLAVGFLAGLLGIGGGMVMVPILAALFSAQALSPAHDLHLALGTAMASVVFTAASSMREHHRLASVDWAIVRQLAPALALGSLLSTLASGWLPQRALALLFAAVVFGGATQIWLGRKPKPGRGLPGPVGLWAVGIAIGIICGLVSAGGAFLTMPFMLFCGVPMRRAVGSGAAMGLPVAALGTVGYVASGWAAEGLPAAALGFVYLPALAALVIASIVTAPIGARTAHRLPVATLKRVFAFVLYALATRMVVSYW